MFHKEHVNGATASTPGVLSDSSDDKAVVEEKTNDIGDMKLTALKKNMTRSARETKLLWKRKKKKVHS